MDKSFLEALNYNLDEIAKADCNACIQGELVRLRKRLEERVYINHYDKCKDFQLSFNISDIQISVLASPKHRNCVFGD